MLGSSFEKRPQLPRRQATREVLSVLLLVVVVVVVVTLLLLLLLLIIILMIMIMLAGPIGDHGGPARKAGLAKRMSKRKSRHIRDI